MNLSVLFVDDEENLLQGIQRSLRKDFTVVTAAGGRAALELIARSAEFPVIVSDMRMPEMDGIALLREVKKRSPNSSRIMLTGNADQQTAIDAVNEGHILRFLRKPCETETLKTALEFGLRQYELVTAEKELLEKTLKGTIRVLTEILSMVNPQAFSRSHRLLKIVRALCAELQPAQAWKIEIAAMMSQLGCVTVPETILQKVFSGHELNSAESSIFESYPQVGGQLLSNIPRLESITEILRYQERHFNGAGFPHNGPAGADLPIGSRILKVALDYDLLNGMGLTPPAAYRKLQEQAERYDPEVLKVLEKHVRDQSEYVEREIDISELTENMVLVEDLFSPGGMLLVAGGQGITRSIAMKLNNMRKIDSGFKQKVRVLVPLYHDARLKPQTAELQG